MSLAALSLAALVLALVVSCVSPINIGVLAIVLAWVVGVYFGGMRVEQVLAGFPVPLFLTLAGVTLMFAQAQGNGTLDRVAQRAVRMCRGIAGVIPMMFFVMTAALSSSGPGNIAATALMAPLGMVWAHTHPFTARVVKPQYTEYGESQRPRVIAAMGEFDRALEEREFLDGKGYSMADIVLQTTVDFAGFVGIPIPEDMVGLRAWHDRVSARPSAQA